MEPGGTNGTESMANSTLEGGLVPGGAIDMGTIIAIVVPIIFAIIVLVGLIGNSLVVIVVKCNPQMYSTTNILILNLAIADLVGIVVPIVGRMTIFLIDSFPPTVIHHSLRTLHCLGLRFRAVAIWFPLVQGGSVLDCRLRLRQHLHGKSRARHVGQSNYSSIRLKRVATDEPQLPVKQAIGNANFELNSSTS